MNIRSRLTKLSRDYRQSICEQKSDLDHYMSSKSDAIMFNGRLIYRKRIILFTIGCQVRTCLMCPFPSESNSSISIDNLINQFDNAFLTDDIDKYDMITIFTNGNFFSDKEMDPIVRKHIFEKLSDSKVSYLTVESLPNFITKHKIDEAKHLLGNVKLQVFMGLQSADDYVRNYCCNSTINKNIFRTVCAMLIDVGFIPAVFLIVKAPFLTEEEGVDDVLRSLNFLDSIDVTHITLCPMRISNNSYLDKIYEMGYYSPLWLWSVVRILRTYHSTSNKADVMVNTTELKQELNPNSICAGGSEPYKDKVIIGIEKYLYSRDRDDLKFYDVLTEKDLDSYYTNIDNEYMYNILTGNTTLETRINNFLHDLEQNDSEQNL